MGFRAEMRAAGVSLLQGYTTANSGALRQIYPGRPRSIYPPCGFVDSINESGVLFTAGPTQRAPSMELILIQGVYDSEEAANLQDALVDGFLEYVRAHIHESGASTLVAQNVSVTDLPNYQPDWIVDAPFYYATRLTLEGLKLESAVTI
jgi:hypothetical protein